MVSIRSFSPWFEVSEGLDRHARIILTTQNSLTVCRISGTSPPPLQEGHQPVVGPLGGTFLISGSFILVHGRWPAIESGPLSQTSPNKTCQTMRFTLGASEQSHTSWRGSPPSAHKWKLSAGPWRAKSAMDQCNAAPNPLRPANMGDFPAQQPILSSRRRQSDLLRA